MVLCALQAISYAFNRNVTTEGVYPYTSGSTGKTGSCDIPLLRSTKPGSVVQTSQDANYVYPWSDEEAIKLVRVRGQAIGAQATGAQAAGIQATGVRHWGLCAAVAIRGWINIP